MTIPFKVDLRDKVAVVTGGTGVLGSCWVDALAACGAKVAILGRNINKANARAEEITNNGGIAIGVKADVINPNSIKGP